MDNDLKIQLGIVDDDRLLVQLLKPLLENSGRIRVTFIAKCGVDFLELIKNGNTPADIILLDLRMKNGSGLEVLNHLQKAKISIKVIVLSSFYQPSYIGQMLKLGAHALLSKQIDKTKLLATIEEVYSKGHSLSVEQMAALRNQLSSRLPRFHLPQKNGLTSREIEVLQLVCLQLNTKEIASKMYISPKTVETHKSNLLNKTGVKNIVGLVIYAAKNKIVNPEELILLDG